MQSQVFKLKVPLKKIAYLKFILEGYSHLAVLTVENPKEGIVFLHFFSLEESIIKEILKDLEIEILNF